MVPAGQEGGTCYADGTCDEGLTCNDQLVCEDLGYCTPLEIGPCLCPDGGVGGRICHSDGNWGTCDCPDDCGNGTCEAVETHQSCPQDCLAAVCGDGIVNMLEECDDGNASNNDACLSACNSPVDCCALNVCGDGHVDASDNGSGGQVEACDDGNNVNGDDCRSDCGQDFTLCGNGVLDQGEACDDGNTVGGDTCSGDCRQVLTVCGDGVVDLGEACDDGAGNSDTAPDACRTDCTAARCGDSVVDTGEVCDDGNTIGADGCSSDCQAVEVCGDGVVTGDEVCDGNQTAGLTCADFGFTDGVLICAVDCGPSLAGCYSCGNGVCEATEGPQSCPADCPGSQAVDVLLVVDNSGTMADEQLRLQTEIANLVDALRDPVNGLPDLHLGVTSTNMGTAPYIITHCENAGDGGDLLTSGCANPVGQPYLIDDAPQGCNITRDASGGCTADDCVQANCVDGTLDTETSTGCPRCRNYSGETLSTALGCIAGLGTTGCGFEQPLEAMRAALDNNPNNAGFLRADSILVVLLLTDEDDCSASDPYLFDTSQSDINDPLGPLNSYRCFEFGITCDINDRTTAGVRHGCIPRGDSGALLFHTDDYLGFLLTLRGPGQIVMAAIAGPVVNNEVTVNITGMGTPELSDVCSSSGGYGAVPGIRLRALVEQLNVTADMGWAYSSICSASYQPALTGLGQGVRFRME